MTLATERPTYIERQKLVAAGARLGHITRQTLKAASPSEREDLDAAYWTGYNSVQVKSKIMGLKLIHYPVPTKRCRYEEGTVLYERFHSGVQDAIWELDERL